MPGLAGLPPVLLSMFLSGCAGAPSADPAAGSPGAPAVADARSPGPHSDAHAGWEPVRWPGKRATAYERDLKDGQRCWRAQAEQSASMFRKRLYVAPGQLGEVEFAWWVDSLVPGADLSVAGQGDAPARLVFAFDGDHGQLSARNRMVFELADALTGERPPYATLMYVWANEAEPGSVIVNPRTDRIRKIVLESGPTHLQQWRNYRRDLAADFRRAFGEEPGPLIGLAMMTDTDNTGSSARTWYGDVTVGGAIPAAVPNPPPR